MKLTPGEIKALMHRVEVPECIYESLGRGDASETDDEYDAAWKNVRVQVESGQVEADKLTPLEKSILGDCLDCGTYWSCHDQENHQKISAVNNIGWALVKKFEANKIPVRRDLLIFAGRP